MIRLLLALLRPLRSLAGSAVRIADALDRLAPVPSRRVETDYLPFDAEEQDAETLRREDYEKNLGRQLALDEEIPADYRARDVSSYIKHFFKRGKADTEGF